MLQEKNVEQEKVLAREKAKAFVAFDAAIDLTIAAYDLTPQRTKDSYADDSVPSKWNPRFSVEEKKGKDGRWSIESLDRMAYGSTRRFDIKIFPRPFLEKLNAEQRKTMVAGGPDRLALTILHETHHWASKMQMFEWSYDANKPSNKRFMEAKAYEAQAKFLESMNRDELKRTGRSLFSPGQIENFREKSKKEEAQGYFIREKLGDPPMEHQLPLAIRRSDTYQEKSETREDDPDFHPIEILKLSGETDFFLSITRDTSDLVDQIQQRNEAGVKRRQKRREQDLFGSGGGFSGSGSSDSNTFASGLVITEIFIPEEQPARIVQQARRAQVQPNVPQRPRVVQRASIDKYHLIAKLARLACNNPHSASARDFSSTWKSAQGVRADSGAVNRFGLGGCENRMFGILMGKAFSRQYPRYSQADLQADVYNSRPQLQDYDHGSSNIYSEPEPEPERPYLPPCWPNCVHWN
ncbi:MAG: hypothetical protein COB53_07275 [Elusimicrobia bacterium]|nr:MAG: hypothetical protein COB53_07275 [Elusimicrobiota bacterium]